MGMQAGTRGRKTMLLASHSIIVLEVAGIAVLLWGGAMIFSASNLKSTRQYGVLMIVVAMTFLSMVGALQVYSSDVQSGHQRTQQRVLMEAFTRAYTMGVGAIFGLLWGMSG